MRGKRGVLGILVVLATSQSGCGVILQSAIGWHSEHDKVINVPHKVEVQSEPAGAEVRRIGPSGDVFELGITPTEDSLDYAVNAVEESPRVEGLLIGAGIEAAAAVGSFAAMGGTSSFGGVAYGLLGGFFTLFVVEDLIVAVVHGASGREVIRKGPVANKIDYTYAGTYEGEEVSVSLRVPDQVVAKLMFAKEVPLPKIAMNQPKTKEAPKETPAPEPVRVTSTEPSRVVAVMEIEDLNAKSKKRRIPPSLVRNVSDQLRIFVAQTGVTTVDRGAQEQALKDQIDRLKNESYQGCYDEGCQIELGKALAASHILRSRITRFGSKCVLNAELIDLRKEVTVKASSAKGNCKAEGFLSMSEEVATQLFE